MLSIFDFSDEMRSRIRLLPQVNWGRGRLQRYQSFGSFAAKFCILNQLTPFKFRELWAEKVECAGLGDAGRIRRIARLLDEPIAVVRTVFNTVFTYDDPSRGRRPDLGPFRIDSKGYDWTNTVSYCEACLANGFHGFFHEDNWFKKCLIHNTNLAREHVSWKWSGSRFDRYVRSLTAVLNRERPGWHVVAAPLFARDELQNLFCFLRWKRLVEPFAQNCTEAVVAKRGCRKPAVYSYRYLDLLLGHLTWMTPMPNSLLDFLIVRPKFNEPEVRRYEKSVGDELYEILSHYSLEELLTFFLAASFLVETKYGFQKTAEDAIQAIDFPHDHDTCGWGRKQYQGWCCFPSGVLKDNCMYSCPRRSAVEEICTFWLQCELERSCDCVEWNSYGSMVRSFANRDLVALVGQGGPRATESSRYHFTDLPVVDFRWSPRVTTVLDTILQKIVESHREELTHWLAAIAAGASPARPDRFPQSVYLIREESGEMVLINWRTDGGQPLLDEAGESWHMGFKRPTLEATSGQ